MILVSVCCASDGSPNGTHAMQVGPFVSGGTREEVLEKLREARRDGASGTRRTGVGACFAESIHPVSGSEVIGEYEGVHFGVTASIRSISGEATVEHTAWAEVESITAALGTAPESFYTKKRLYSADGPGTGYSLLVWDHNAQNGYMVGSSVLRDISQSGENSI